MSTKLKLALATFGYTFVCWHYLHSQAAPAPAQAMPRPETLAPQSLVAAPAQVQPAAAPAPSTPSVEAPAEPVGVEAPAEPVAVAAAALPEADAAVVQDTRRGLQDALDRMLSERAVQFVEGEATIDPSSLALLDEVAEVLKRAPRWRVEVQGHTDNAGNPVVNRDMSARRAAAVARYLAGRGVVHRRMVVLGFGSERPIADNATPEGRRTNRRIGFRVTGVL